LAIVAGFFISKIISNDLAAPSAMLTGLRRRLGELSLGENIPTMCQWRNMVEAGYLASYGIIKEDLCALSADQLAQDRANRSKKAKVIFRQIDSVRGSRIVGSICNRVRPTGYYRCLPIVAWFKRKHSNEQNCRGHDAG